VVGGNSNVFEVKNGRVGAAHAELWPDFIKVVIFENIFDENIAETDGLAPAVGCIGTKIAIFWRKKNWRKWENPPKIVTITLTPQSEEIGVYLA
jgi:hypothetical protein